jgi:DNA-directed RNA polymerase specialized sigma24 family protein
MEREESFDSFYRATRRQVLHQAFALTGDLQAASTATRDAYVAAWHHWRKVEPLDDRLAWVRPHAWQRAQRRHAGRIWHRNKGLDASQQATLDALSRLSSTQRRTLLLVQLAGVPLQSAARELGVTRDLAERHLQNATAAVAVQLDTDPLTLRNALLDLDRALDAVSLPRPSIIRRAGQKRRQAHTLVAVVAATVVAVASGAVAYQPPPGQEQPSALDRVLPDSPSPASEVLDLPSADNLLDQDQIRRLGLDQEWEIRKTHSNTSGDGINTICQQERFADPDGLAALVRTFEATPPVDRKGREDRSVRRRAVQTVEVSASLDQARAAYDTTLGWYAGCRVGRLQLLGAYRVGNIGAEADVLTMRLWKRPVTTYSIAVARIGTVTTSTVSTTSGATPPPVTEITQSLADAVSMLCARSGSNGCAKSPSGRAVPPPPSGEQKGMVAAVDLPPVGRIRQPWIGAAIPARPNPSLTTCDRANFVKAGAKPTKARAYVIPEAQLPPSFGLSETYGVFSNPTRARRFVDGVRDQVAGCEDRDLATSVTSAASGRLARSGAQWWTWGLETEVSENRSVRFRVGFVRVGDKVAQLTFVAAPDDDLSTDSFRALVIRAGDRLRELD